MSRTAKMASIVVLALGLAGCSDADPVEARTLVETLVDFAGVGQEEAQCAADKIFGPGSGFTEDQIREAEEDLSSVPGFQDFATDALRECGAIDSLQGPVLDS
jgi:hypothetical protein